MADDASCHGGLRSFLPWKSEKWQLMTWNDSSIVNLAPPYALGMSRHPSSWGKLAQFLKGIFVLVFRKDTLKWSKTQVSTGKRSRMESAKPQGSAIEKWGLWN